MCTLSTSPGSAPSIYTGPVSVCGPRPGKSVLSFLICSIVTPGTTWLCECIIVSNRMVSPESTCSTGGCALLNQPHCVVSIVAGRRWVFPVKRLAGTARSFSCSGVEAGDIGAGGGATAGGGAGVVGGV